MTDSNKIQEAINEFLKNDPDAAEEENIQTEIVSLEIKNGLKYEKKSNGIIRILKIKSTGRYRLTMRANKTYEVLLNHYILPSLTLGLTELSYKVDDFSTNEKTTKEIKIVFPPSRNDQAKSFKENFNKAKEENNKLLKQ